VLRLWCYSCCIDDGIITFAAGASTVVLGPGIESSEEREMAVGIGRRGLLHGTAFPCSLLAIWIFCTSDGSPNRRYLKNRHSAETKHDNCMQIDKRGDLW